MRILIVFCFVEKKIKKLQVEKTWSNENVRKVHRLRYEGMTFHCFVREFKNAMNNGFKNKIWVSIFIFFGIPNCLTMANGVKPKGGKKKLRIKGSVSVFYWNLREINVIISNQNYISWIPIQLYTFCRWKKKKERLYIS